MAKIININRTERRKEERKNRKILDDLRKINRMVNSLTEVDFSDLKAPMITVYFNTIDFPGKIVARVFELQLPTNICVLYETMEDARDDAIEAGFQTLIPRSRTDDPNIVETYMP